MQHVVVLGQCCGFHAVQRGGHILKAVTGGGAADIHDNAARRHAQLTQQHIELLGQVDVDRGFGADLLVVGQSDRRADRLVVFLSCGQNEDVLAIQRLGQG